MVRKIFIAAAISASFITTAATAGGVEDRIRALAADQLSQWVQSATVIDAVREQNEKHAGLSQSDIDALDQAWRNFRLLARRRSKVSKDLWSRFRNHLCG